MKNKSLITILLVVGVYLLSTGISYSLFSGSLPGGSSLTPDITTPKETNDYEALVFDPDAPKTEVCPLNGLKYSKQQKDWWENHRPLAIMVENHEEARPQSGLNAADITYEAVAEGGITRTMNIYYCQDAGIVGPVRSARTYFLDWVSEYGANPLYAHVGGANTPGPADALGQIVDYGWNQYNDLNQFSIGFPVFKRDEGRAGRPVATEHTVYSTTTKLWDVAKERGLTEKDKEGNAWSDNFEPYEFKDEPDPTARAAAQTIHLEPWEGYAQYSLDWVYNKAGNTYLRKSGGVDHLDRNTKKQLSAKNVVVLMMVEGRANDGYEGNAHLIYRNEGTGKALIFMNGKQITGTWKKADRESKTLILDNTGKEVIFNRGKIWFQILPLDGVMSVE